MTRELESTQAAVVEKLCVNEIRTIANDNEMDNMKSDLALLLHESDVNQVQIANHAVEIQRLREKDFKIYMRELVATVQNCICREVGGVESDENGQERLKYTTLAALQDAFNAGSLTRIGDETYQSYVKELGGNMDDFISLLVQAKVQGNKTAHPEIDKQYMDELVKSFAKHPLTRKVVDVAKKHCPDVWISEESIF